MHSLRLSAARAPRLLACLVLLVLTLSPAPSAAGSPGLGALKSPIYDPNHNTTGEEHVIDEQLAANLPVVVKTEGPKVCLNGNPCIANAFVSFPGGEASTAPVPYTVVSTLGQTITSGTFNRTNEQGLLVTHFEFEFVSTSNGWNDMAVVIGDSSARYIVQVMPGAVTIIPIIVLLIVAFVTRQVLFALALGVFLAAMFINNYNPIIGFERMLDTYMVNAVADPDHAFIILFTFFTAALIALVQKSGGATGLALAITKYAKTRTSAMWMSYVLGVLIFFDDYASCLIVGNQMRPITDLFYISHEKLAFITHTTSAAPASIVPLSAWIGFELSLLSEAMATVGDTSDPFSTLCETIPGRFYPFFMLFFIPALIGWKRDFGPMLNAERRALNTHQLQPPNELVTGNVDEFEEYDEATKKGKKPHWIHAVIPLAICISVIIITLLLTGYYVCLDDDIPITVANMTGNGDSYGALMYGSFLAALIATIQYKIAGVMSFSESILTWIQGIRGIVEAVLVLILAWSISAAINDMGTATWIVSALSGGGLDYRGLPSLIFLLCCIMSFCTGSSWGTMSIVFPLAIPLAVGLAPESMKHTVIVDNAAAILAGSIFGDQCSPISDTSILSALSSRVSVNAHVSSQMPYAILNALLAILIGLLPVGYGAYPSYAGLLLGIPIIVGLVWLLGTPVESDKPDKFAFISKWRLPKGLKQPVEDAPYAYAVDHYEPGVKIDVTARAMTLQEAFGDLERFNTEKTVPPGPELARKLTRITTIDFDQHTHEIHVEFADGGSAEEPSYGTLKASGTSAEVAATGDVTAVATPANSSTSTTPIPAPAEITLPAPNNETSTSLGDAIEAVASSVNGKKTD